MMGLPLVVNRAVRVEKCGRLIDSGSPPLPLHLDAYLAEQDGPGRHNDRPITGWPLPIIADLDRRGARGLLADLAGAGALARQAAYIVVIDADLDQPAAFLRRLGIMTEGAAGIGEALRTRQARDLIAATYAVPPDAVPTGLLRALLRIEERSSDNAGFDALVHCADYRRLLDIFMLEKHGRKAHALRYCGPQRSSQVHAVEHLTPVLIHPEIVAIMNSASDVIRANGLLDLIRASVSTITEDEIARAVRESLKGGNILDRAARKLLERADLLPEPPLLPCQDLRPLRTAADLKEFGARLSNCALTKLAEIALGLFYIYEIKHLVGDRIISMAVSLTPLTNGLWVVADVTMRKNRRPPAHVMRAVLEQLQDLGAVIAGPSPAAAYRQDVARLLGAHRWAALDEVLRLEIDPEGEEDAVEALMAEIGEAA